MLRALALRTFLSLSAAGLVAVGCAGANDDATDDVGESEDAVTDTRPTAVKDQQNVGFCWIFTTVAWAEGLHQIATGQAKDFSEGYLGYWYWYMEITRQDALGESAAKGALARTCKAPGPTPATTAETMCAPPPTGADVTCTLSPRQGGHFDWARHLMSRFGLMTEASFVGDGFEDKGLRAFNRIRDSLSTGALKTMAARRDRALVRRELDRAWGLSDATIRAMNAAFGPRGPDDLVAFTRSVGPIVSASDLPVHSKRPGEAARTVKLADLLGEGPFAGPREGALAWRDLSYPSAPSEQKTFIRRAQRALNDRQALPIGYWNERSALDPATATYSAERVAEVGPRISRGRHAVLLVDYEVTNVPGFGTLPAGVKETRPEALAASLDPRATISFLRFKNSWGDDNLNQGFYDMTMSFVDGPVTKTNSGSCKDGRPLQTPDAGLYKLALPAGY
jgi:hypothetical protein